ncbi:MAG: glycosyltransferase [Opitutus sp.]|nr:glycosyltransferase [Opitutus sp.]
MEPAYHVLWLTENYPPHRGGMAVSCDRIVRTLRAPRLSIDVAHCTTRQTEWRVDTRAHEREITCPVNDDVEHALNRLWTIISEQAASEPFTHVVAFGGLLPMLGAPVFSAWLGVPLITLIRGNDFDAGIFSLKRGDVLRSALSASDCVGAVSRDKVDKISALFPGTSVAWTPNGIDLSDWALHPSDFAPAADWRRAHVSPGRQVIGIFGQLKRKKGGAFFLEALLASGLAACFHVLLVGEIEPELSGWLEQHRDEVAFTLLPFLDRYELLPHYAACDWVAIPSFYDGMPNVLLESAALGVPALAARTGGMRDLLVDDEHAVLFAPGDAPDCARAIERAAHLDEAGRHRLGRNSRTLVTDGYDHRLEAQHYREIFARTARRAPATPSCTPPSVTFSASPSSS